MNVCIFFLFLFVSSHKFFRSSILSAKVRRFFYVVLMVGRKRDILSEENAGHTKRHRTPNAAFSLSELLVATCVSATGTSRAMYICIISLSRLL